MKKRELEARLQLSKKTDDCIGDPTSMITKQEQLSWCFGQLNHAKRIWTPQLLLVSFFGELLQLNVFESS